MGAARVRQRLSQKRLAPLHASTPDSGGSSSEWASACCAAMASMPIHRWRKAWRVAVRRRAGTSRAPATASLHRNAAASAPNRRPTSMPTTTSLHRRATASSGFECVETFSRHHRFCSTSAYVGVSLFCKSSRNSKKSLDFSCVQELPDLYVMPHVNLSQNGLSQKWLRTNCTRRKIRWQRVETMIIVLMFRFKSSSQECIDSIDARYPPKSCREYISRQSLLRGIAIDDSVPCHCMALHAFNPPPSPSTLHHLRTLRPKAVVQGGRWAARD